MTNRNDLVTVLVAASGLLSACGSSSSSSGSTPAESTAPSDAALCPVVVADADCDKTQRPFVFVHGTYGSGDNFAAVAQLLASNGFCPERIVGVEYNSVAQLTGVVGVNTDTLIDSVVDQVLAETGFDKVDIAGHSQGTSHCGTYLADPAHAAKIAHYINFSGVPNVGDVDTLSLSSLHDLGGSPHHATGNKVKTVTFTDQDHFAVAASKDSFVEVYKYLTGNDPKYKDVQCGAADGVTVAGISETFADNVPVPGKIELRELSSTPRAADVQPTVITPDADGHFGPIKVKRNGSYEFKGFDADGKLVGYQYFTPFKRSNRLLRMLTPSNNTLVKGQSTDHVVTGPNHVGLVTRWAGGAFRQDLGASMTIDGTEVLTDENAGAGALAHGSGLSGGVVGFFMYDANSNMQTDLGLVYSSSFIAFTDVFLDATASRFIELSFTPGSEDPSTVGNKVKIPNWPSADGLVSVMFQ